MKYVALIILALLAWQVFAYLQERKQIKTLKEKLGITDEETK